MTEERQPWDHMYQVKHELGMRDFSSYGHDGYDPNIRYVLEDIAIQLARIADTLQVNSSKSKKSEIEPPPVGPWYYTPERDDL